ncbi:universal stress protein [Algoriphagus sp.]|uniref:universal stress protein n=1 Tax=Algoriphagus sp. TaxID=1872435 RepID=UPI0025F0DA04|nr:universal stress protein [Algoriphagus sp.]
MIKVLVPYDFSEQAQNALNFTTGLAEKIDGVHIEVVNVLEVPYVSSIGTMGGGEVMPEMENQIFFIQLMERRKEQVADLKEKYKDKRYTFNAKLKLGNAFKSISESILEENPDLVIMGSKGSSGVEEVLIGSNTEKVVRTATCPVVTVKSATDPNKFKKIVFASDFKEDEDEIARRMKNLQSLFDADLYFVVVNTPANFETTRDSIKRIGMFVKKYGFEGVKAEIYNSLSEESGIIEFAEDIDADLIAMATHGRTGFLHLITGSIAEDVVNHAKRPVWTLKVK